MFKRILLAAASLVAAHSAFADWPERPITLIVPYSAGGLTDTVSRAIAQEVGKNLGQPILIDNRVGAGGKVGLDQLKRAPKDGYTIGLAVPATMSTLPLTDPNFNLQPLKDFDPITIAVDTFLVLVADPKAYRSAKLGDFVNQSRQLGSRLNYATPGAGTSRHFDSVILLQKLGLAAQHIPFRGEAPSLTALASGEIQFLLASDSARPLIEAGRIRPIAVAAAQRVISLPEVPTFAELGVDFQSSGWVGYIAPAGVPNNIMDRLNRAFVDALRAPAVREALVGMGYQPVASSRRAFRETVEKDTQRYKALLASGAVKIDQ